MKFSTLQDYGVDKVFFLENGNADTSQRNVVFIARGESARNTQVIAGMYVLMLSIHEIIMLRYPKITLNAYRGKARRVTSFPYSGYRAGHLCRTRFLRKLVF